MVFLFGTGSFLVTAFSYLLGVFKIFLNFPAVMAVMKDFFASFFK